MSYPERLKELKTIYENVPFEHTYWKDLPQSIDINNFRHRYIGFGFDVNQYKKTFDYIKQIDQYKLFSCLSEDGHFAPDLYDVDGIKVSRDLMDSILELTFMRKVIGPSLEEAKILDIGAGYGRLAHRLSNAFPKTFTYCVDGVALSTYLSEIYIKHRGIEDRAKVVPFNELETIGNVNVACNIHSWSECTMDAIEFWLDILQKSNAEYFFLVPHRGDVDGIILSEDKHNFYPSILNRGFNLIEKAPKYPVGIDGMEPANYYMFKR